PLIVGLTPISLPRLSEVALNPRALGAAAALAGITTLFFGLVPAILLRRQAITAGLRSSERGSSRQSAMIYRALVIGEVALAAALLASSALLVRTVTRMTDTPTGIAADGTLVASLQLSGTAYTDWKVVSDTYGALLANMRQRPGIRAAGASNFLPFEPGWRVPFGIEGQPPPAPNDAPMAQYHSVTDGYFESMGARVVSGRSFSDRDGSDVPGVAIVNEAFVKRYLNDAPPVGRFLTTTATGIGPLGRR